MKDDIEALRPKNLKVGFSGRSPLRVCKLIFVI